MAVPLQGQGQLSSITQALLDNYDFGVAVDANTIVSALQAELDALQQGFSLVFTVKHRETFVIDWVTVNISWRITLSQVKAEWSAGFLLPVGQAGMLTIKIVGHARTQKSEYNWDFEVSHLVAVTLNSATEALAFTPVGDPIVNVTGPFASDVEPHARRRISEEVKTRIATETGKLDGVFTFATRKKELIDRRVVRRRLWPYRRAIRRAPEPGAKSALQYRALGEASGSKSQRSGADSDQLTPHQQFRATSWL